MSLRKLQSKFFKRPKLPKDWVGPGEPLSRRKQIFLPEFTITLIRTPFLPPRFASFYVPLNFNKLDMRDYMERVYNVKVLRVRSYIEQQKVTRERKDGEPGYGPLRRPLSKKKMTIEMAEPFVWPEAPKDLSLWERDQFYSAEEYQSEYQKSQQPKASMEPVKGERDAYEEQAKGVLEGRETWRPTWQALGLNYGKPVVPNLKNAKAFSHPSSSSSSSSSRTSETEPEPSTSESQSDTPSR